MGAHNSSKNSGTSGICCIGDYTGSSVPTEALWNSLYKQLAFLCFRFGLDPIGVAYHTVIGRTNDIIDGHKDSGGGTECPANIANYYTTIRNNVLKELSGSFLDDFELGAGHFGSYPTYSGSTVGIDPSSILARVTNSPYEGNGCLMAELTHNTSDASPWTVRLLSGTGDPNNNISLPAVGTICFWLKTSTAMTGATVQIWVDDSDGTEASQELTINNSGAWNLYTFDLANFNGTTINTGNGKIDAANITLDAIVLNQPNTSTTWRVYFDDVLYNPSGSGTMVIESELKVPDVYYRNNDDIIIYPNPNNGQFTIEFKNKISNECDIEIFDISGVMIYGAKCNSGIQEVNISKLQVGLYFVMVKCKEFNKTLKMVVR